MFLYDKIRTLLCADHFLSRYFSKAKQTAAGQPLHRIFRASLHAYGGAFYSVTCSQRKYHCSRLRILARSFAEAASQRGVSRSSLFSPLWGLSLRTRCTAQRRQNVSVCPIHFFLGSSTRENTSAPMCFDRLTIWLFLAALPCFFQYPGFTGPADHSPLRYSSTTHHAAVIIGNISRYAHCFLLF